jgi:hypothetical protein
MPYSHTSDLGYHVARDMSLVFIHAIPLAQKAPLDEYIAFINLENQVRRLGADCYYIRNYHRSEKPAS